MTGQKRKSGEGATKEGLLEEIHQLREELARRQAECKNAREQAEASWQLMLEEKEAGMANQNSDQSLIHERFANAMRGANDGLWDWNLETDEVYYSPRWKSMLGFSENELSDDLGTWASLVHPDDKDWVLQKTNDYIEGRDDLFEVEMRMCHKDGHEVVVLSRAFLVDGERSDKPTRLVGTHVDITDRTKSEQFIVATSDILKMIATREPASEIYDAIAHLYEGRHPGLRCSMLILSGNKLLHAGAPSLPEEYCKAVNGLENGPNVGSCGTATYHGIRVLVENIETDPKWAKIKHVALPHGMRCCWSEPIKNSTGDVLGAFGMYYDYPALPNENEAHDLASAARLAGIIMEREKSEKELNQYKNHLEDLVTRRTRELEETKQEAEEASLAKSKFLSNMSHELRTPLNAIIGFGQLLVSDPVSTLNVDQEEGLEQILKSGEHLLELITEILSLSQIEAGKLSLSIEPIRLDSVIDEASDLVQALALKHQVSVVNGYTSQPGSEAFVLADPLRLKQILLNLLSNGIKYNKPGGEVKVTVDSDEEHHHITVTDTGVGIAEKDIINVFEPFNRLGAEAGNIEGTGIGLTLTKRLAEVMNGSVAIKSAPGEGSAFTVTMPVAEGGELEAPRTDLKTERPPVENLDTTILYVEDNQVNIKLVRKIFQRRPNLRLAVACTGTEGIEIASRELPSLILMDMHLPDMTGIEAMRELRKNGETANIPIVGVSADAMPDMVKRSEIEGFKDYITKPFEIDRLLAVVDTCAMPNGDRGDFAGSPASGARDEVALPS